MATIYDEWYEQLAELCPAEARLGADFLQELGTERPRAEMLRHRWHIYTFLDCTKHTSGTALYTTTLFPESTYPSIVNASHSRIGWEFDPGHPTTAVGGRRRRYTDLYPTGPEYHIIHFMLNVEYNAFDAGWSGHVYNGEGHTAADTAAIRGIAAYSREECVKKRNLFVAHQITLARHITECVFDRRYDRKRALESFRHWVAHPNSTPGPRGTDVVALISLKSIVPSQMVEFACGTPLTWTDRLLAQRVPVRLFNPLRPLLARAQNRSFGQEREEKDHIA